MSNDKPWVILAIILLAALGTYAGWLFTSPKEFTALLEFFKILASGLFGLVTGAAWQKLKQVKKEKEGGEKNG